MLVRKLIVVNGRNQVKAQPKPLAPVAVALRQNPKDFQAADDVFYHETLLRQLPVGLLFLVGERVQLAFLVRRLAVGMMPHQAQIAAVRQAAGPAKQSRPALDQQLEVVPLARAEGRGDDAPTSLLDQALGFLRVALLLAAVPQLLLFWGRSTGHSVASTTTT